MRDIEHSVGIKALRENQELTETVSKGTKVSRERGKGIHELLEAIIKVTVAWKWYLPRWQGLAQKPGTVRPSNTGSTRNCLRRNAIGIGLRRAVVAQERPSKYSETGTNE